MKEYVILQSWEKIAAYWKTRILTNIQYVWKGDPSELCGVLMDPAQFIPLYVERFLVRRELEGDPLQPGHYVIEIKVWNGVNKKRKSKTYLNL